MVDPSTLTVADARKLIATTTPPLIRASLAYLDGDVWQKGEGWVGPRLLANSPGSSLLMEEIRKGLAGANLIRDLVGRHAAGVLGREPQWELSVFAQAEPEDEEEEEEEGDEGGQPPSPGQPAADEEDEEPPTNPDSEAMTAWWDRVVMETPDDGAPSPVGGVLGRALTRALCGDVPVLRLRVISPQSPLDGEVPPPPAPTTLGEALERIAVEVLPGQAATVLRELDEGPIAAAIVQAGARSLAVRLGKAAAVEAAEFVALDPDGNTLIIAATRRRRGEGPALAEVSDPLPLGGRLTMMELRVPPLVTEALIGIQRQLTKTLTVMGRNTDVAGFVERIFLNAARPGRKVPDPNAPGGERFEPAPYQAGPGTANWLVGEEQPDGTLATPSAVFRDPVSPETFLDTAAGLTFYAHKEARQLHALIAGEATPSGESRRQAAADFLASLGPSARAVEGLTRWLLETTYALARALMRQPVPDDLRATVKCLLSGTLPTVEELRETRDAVDKKLLARATYQTAAGVADTEAEDEQIQKDREANPPPPALAAAATTTTPPNTTPAVPPTGPTQEDQ